MIGQLFKKIKAIGESLCPPLLAPSLKRLIRITPYARGKMAEGPCTEEPKGGRVLEEAWQHLVAANAGPKCVASMPASPRWEALLERIRLEISFFTSSREAIHFAQSRIDFDHREPVYYAWPLYKLHADTLKAEFPQFSAWFEQMSDSPLSRPDSLLNCGGRLISNILFCHVRFLCGCLAHAPKVDMVCEIGGGYGAPARLWLNNPIRQPKTYVILDFPESLYFAEVFLRSNFENLALHYVTDSKPLDPAFAARQRVILCPIHLLDAVAPLSFDLVTNTGSMQEMPDEWIDFWMAWLSRQDCRWFYSMNYFGQPLDSLMETGNMWSPRLNSDWVVRRQQFDPPFLRQQSDRNFAELIAEKVPQHGLGGREKARARYDMTRHRIMDNQMLMEVMDIIRLDADEDIVWDALQRTMAQTCPIPKEAYYLADRLTRQGTPDFQRQHGAELAETFVRLKAIRASGRENTYSA